MGPHQLLGRCRRIANSFPKVPATLWLQRRDSGFLNKGQLEPKAATVHSGKIIAMNLNEDQVSRHQSVTASNTLGVWAAMLIFLFNGVKALESRDLFKRADRNSMRLPYSTSTQWIKRRNMLSEKGFAFFLQQTSTSTHQIPAPQLGSCSPSLFHPLFPTIITGCCNQKTSCSKYFPCLRSPTSLNHSSGWGGWRQDFQPSQMGI